mmetsp:Transcript_18489/g.42186  ORF Transcript_18489/g.42186 Transcript_18489/m.42186 type:complete len:209 (+) Transcript_18489:1040-1666(+)
MDSTKRINQISTRDESRFPTMTVSLNFVSLCTSGSLCFGDFIEAREPPTDSNKLAASMRGSSSSSESTGWGCVMLANAMSRKPAAPSASFSRCDSVLPYCTCEYGDASNIESAYTVVLMMFSASTNETHMPKYIVLMYTAGPVSNVRMAMAIAQVTSRISASSAWHFSGALRHGIRTQLTTPETNPIKILMRVRPQLVFSSVLQESSP